MQKVMHTIKSMVHNATVSKKKIDSLSKALHFEQSATLLKG